MGGNERNGKERKGNETKRNETQRKGTYLGTSVSYLGSLVLDLGTFGPELGTLFTYLVGWGGEGGGLNRGGQKYPKKGPKATKNRTKVSK